MGDTDFEKFVLEHSGDDTSRLILSRDRWPGIDVNAAVTAIGCRRKIHTKLPEWYAEAGIIYPDRVCAEQSSSSATAAYKASVAERIMKSEHVSGGRIADLTGGLGVDSLAFSRVASSVLYNEMSPERAAAAEHNFRLLGAGNIEVVNSCVTPDGHAFWDRLKAFGPDIIYMDPARRSSDGSKVFLLEDCSPDVLTLLPEIFGIAPELLLKLSPMADISMLVNRLREHGAGVAEVHVVAAAGECKELLLRVRNGLCDHAELVVNENGNVLAAAVDGGCAPVLLESPAQLMTMKWLFEPGKALAKAGLFNAVCTMFPGDGAAVKAGRSTHLYFLGGDAGNGVEDADLSGAPRIRDFGKLFRIIDMAPLDKRSIRDFSSRYPKAEVSARNVPMTSEELRRKLKAASGGDLHIFGIHLDFMEAPAANYLVCVSRRPEG